MTLAVAEETGSAMGLSWVKEKRGKEKEKSSERWADFGSPVDGDRRDSAAAGMLTNHCRVKGTPRAAEAFNFPPLFLPSIYSTSVRPRIHSREVIKKKPNLK